MWQFNVLVIDDDEEMRNVLNIIVQQIGGNVVAEGHDGKEAVSYYIQLRPHIVLLDVQMPKYDGITALKKIKAINPKACVIMLTSENSVGIVKNCINAGANSYVLKKNPTDVIAKELEKGWSKYLNQLTGAA